MARVWKKDETTDLRRAWLGDIDDITAKYNSLHDIKAPESTALVAPHSQAAKSAPPDVASTQESVSFVPDSQIWASELPKSDVSASDSQRHRSEPIPGEQSNEPTELLEKSVDQDMKDDIDPMLHGPDCTDDVEQAHMDSGASHWSELSNRHSRSKSQPAIAPVTGQEPMMFEDDILPDQQTLENGAHSQHAFVDQLSDRPDLFSDQRPHGQGYHGRVPGLADSSQTPAEQRNEGQGSRHGQSPFDDIAHTIRDFSKAQDVNQQRAYLPSPDLCPLDLSPPSRGQRHRSKVPEDDLESLAGSEVQEQLDKSDEETNESVEDATARGPVTPAVRRENHRHNQSQHVMPSSSSLSSAPPPSSNYFNPPAPRPPRSGAGLHTYSRKDQAGGSKRPAKASQESPTSAPSKKKVKRGVDAQLRSGGGNGPKTKQKEAEAGSTFETPVTVDLSDSDELRTDS